MVTMAKYRDIRLMLKFGMSYGEIEAQSNVGAVAIFAITYSRPIEVGGSSRDRRFQRRTLARMNQCIGTTARATLSGETGSPMRSFLGNLTRECSDRSAGVAFWIGVVIGCVWLVVRR